ncbi:MAG: tetratricopeptide repeat protein, partial [Candidatus Edwardsbacteria bacterium]|nr:tetratricopeptide repeat protein [Candidatus Edwardsbacteria bacterium]
MTGKDITYGIDEIREKLRDLADSPEKVDLLNELSLQLRDNDAKQALEAATAARVMAEALGYQRGSAYGLRNMASCLYWLSDYAEALNKAFEARRLFEQLGDKQGIYRALNTIGNVYYKLGDSVKSLECDIKLLDIARELHDPVTEASALGNIGLVYMEMGDDENALGYFQKSLDQYAAIGRSDCEANPLMNIGIIHRRMKRYDQALEYLNRSLTARQKQQDRPGEALVWQNIGTAHFERGELTSAAESYQRSIEIARNCGDRRIEADSLLKQARVKGRQDLTAAAFSQLQHAQELIDQTGGADMRPALYEVYAELFERTEDFQRSLEYCRKYHAAGDELRTRQAGERLRGLRIGFEADQSRKENELYRLKNIELTRVNQELEQLNRLIKKGNEHRSKLMEQVAEQAQELERLSKQDGLTGLYNRRHLDETLAREFARAKRYHDPLAVAML